METLKKIFGMSIFILKYSIFERKKLGFIPFFYSLQRLDKTWKCSGSTHNSEIKILRTSCKEIQIDCNWRWEPQLSHLSSPWMYPNHDSFGTKVDLRSMLSTTSAKVIFAIIEYISSGLLYLSENVFLDSSKETAFRFLLRRKKLEQS